MCERVRVCTVSNSVWPRFNPVNQQFTFLAGTKTTEAVGVWPATRQQSATARPPTKMRGHGHAVCPDGTIWQACAACCSIHPLAAHLPCARAGLQGVRWSHVGLGQRRYVDGRPVAVEQHQHLLDMGEFVS